MRKYNFKKVYLIFSNAIMSLLISLMIFSCNKKKSEVSPEVCTKIVSVVSNNRTLTFTYDDKDRIIKTRQVVTGSDAPETGTYTYTYNAKGKIEECISISDDPNYPNGAYTAKKTILKYTYDGLGRILSCAKGEYSESEESISLDSSFFNYTSANKVECLRKKYISSPAMLTDSIHTFIDLDADGDPVSATYQPYKNSYYDNVTLSFSRDTLIPYSKFEYLGNDLNFWPFPPDPETILDQKKTLKKYTNYITYLDNNNQPDNVVLFQISNEFTFASNGNLSSLLIKEGLMLEEPPSYSFDSNVYQFNFQQINYDCQ